MNHAAYSDDYIRAILGGVKSIAMVGLSANAARPSYFALGYLLKKGYRVVGVNPALAGKSVLGAPCYARLADVPEAIDMIDVFRGADAVPGILEEALAMTPRPRVFWMQLGVRHDDAAAKAEAAGLQVVMNRCPKIEIGRLSGEIGWLGINSGVMSSRPLRPVRPAPG
jgi:predicted CoA-binding protein